MIMPSASQHVLFPMGGAGSRGPADYPIPWRRSNWVVHPFGLWTDPADDERAIRWTRDVRADVHPWATGAVYLNFIGDEGTERVVAGLARTTTTGSPRSRPSTTRTTCSTSTTTSFPSTRPRPECELAVESRCTAP